MTEDRQSCASTTRRRAPLPLSCWSDIRGKVACSKCIIGGASLENFGLMKEEALLSIGKYRNSHLLTAATAKFALIQSGSSRSTTFFLPSPLT